MDPEHAADYHPRATLLAQLRMPDTPLLDQQVTGEASNASEETLVLADTSPAPSGEPISAPIEPVGLLDPATSTPWDRYEDLGLIGRGGMGEVRRVRDRVMGRVLAMKLLAPERGATAESRARFLAEARLTASLQHPGIVPVHECGALPDGRLWFTMQEVRGRTLGAKIAAMHEGREGPAPESIRRVLDLYARVCETVAYAHSRGVVHRDLKPENVMIGAFGEVLVLDWGIAKAAPEGASEAASEGALTAAGPLSQRSAPEQEGDVSTLLGANRTHGGVLGTPSYMAPEQARGERIGRRTDVYALGAMLYEILSGEPPYADAGVPVWSAVIVGPPTPIAARCKAPVPADLVAICERAMAREPRDRPADARALAEAVRGFLDGARRREQARARVAEARALGPSIAALRAQAASLRDEARALLRRVQAFDPAEEKAPGWAMEDEARALLARAAEQEVIWQQKLRAALEEAPDLDEAHALLADAHADDLRAAEEARDAQAEARAEALLRAHDRGRYAALLRGEGAITLITDPEGAEVTVSRFVKRGRRLVLEPVGELGRTPIVRASLPRGSYLLHVRAKDREEVRYPVRVSRGEAWEGIRPGSREPFVLRLPRAGSIAIGEALVPAGWFTSGGDPAGSESLPARAIWIDAFVIQRHPVTQAEYLAFLNDLIAQGRDGDAEIACPRAARASASGVDVPLFSRDDAGRFTPGPHTPAELHAHPMAMMTWLGATLYASWRAEKTGLPWRLAGELEREKAARGVDGRIFPWGDQPETTWACMVSSRPGAAGIVSIDDFPTDESPYGVRGLAGNVRDWCVDRWTPEGPDVDGGLAHVEPAPRDDPGLRSIRGGAWSAAPPSMCSAASRFAALPDERFATVGLRLARPI